MIYYSQFWPSLWGFKAGSGKNPTKPTLGVVCGSVFGAFVVALIVLIKGRDFGNDAAGWAWIDEVRTGFLSICRAVPTDRGIQIYALSYVKLIITVVKYLPQIWLNYKNKSTVGWSIMQVLLDFGGAILSLLQLLIDSALERDWSGITGNPVKFMLGNLGIVYNIIFITQHCILYRHAKDTEVEEDADEQRPLLGANGHSHNANS
ncbi:MAG: hypothetical protein Q9165_003687 [Trypethelium subeluteriae]